MTGRVIFLLEEPSMKILLDGFLPRLIPGWVEGEHFTLIRLVCQELESWYVGDLQSLALAFDDPKLDAPALRKRFSVPDDWQKPSAELSRLIPTFQKGSGARAMSAHLRGAHNRSKSFQVFVEGVQRIATEMPCE